MRGFRHDLERAAARRCCRFVAIEEYPDLIRSSAEPTIPPRHHAFEPFHPAVKTADAVAGSEPMRGFRKKRSCHAP
jgi:hypothetical protein